MILYTSVWDACLLLKENNIEGNIGMGIMWNKIKQKVARSKAGLLIIINN